MTSRPTPDAAPPPGPSLARDHEIEREGLEVLAAAAVRKAEAAERASQAFVGEAAHDLRRPLTVLLAWVPTLRKAASDAAVLARGLAAVERASRAQARTIEELMDRWEQAGGRPQVDLAAILQSCRDAALGPAEQKRIRLEAWWDPAGVTGLGDAVAMRHVASWLLEHAVELAPPGGAVLLRAAREGASVQLSVEAPDPAGGPGTADAPRRSEAEDWPRLAIVRRLMELQGGTLTAGGPGGAAFTVTLPAASAPAGVEAADPPQPERAAPGDDPARTSLRGLSVLVVDDDADGRETLMLYLEQHGAQVEAVASADEAIGALRRRARDVLVSDIGLPGTDGYELIRQVRELRPEEGGRMPALALTGYAQEQDRRRAVSAGYQDHVVKPVDPADLVAKIAELAARGGGAG